MKKVLLLSMGMLVSSTAFADHWAAPKKLPCERYASDCYDCCANKPNSYTNSKWECRECYIWKYESKEEEFQAGCKALLKKKPNMCSPNPNQIKPAKEYDENNLPEPELKDSDVDNSKPLPVVTDNGAQAPQPDSNAQAPQPDSNAQAPQPDGNAQAPEIAENKSQDPQPVENKKSCSAMVFASGQNGIWALMAAFMLGLLAYLVRRKCR